MTTIQAEHYQKTVLLLGIAAGISHPWVGIPSKVGDVIARVRCNQEVSQIEVDLAVSILEAMIKKSAPSKHKEFMKWREDLLGKQVSQEEEEYPWKTDGTIN